MPPDEGGTELGKGLERRTSWDQRRYKNWQSYRHWLEMVEGRNWKRRRRRRRRYKEEEEEEEEGEEEEEEREEEEVGKKACSDLIC